MTESAYDAYEAARTRKRELVPTMLRLVRLHHNMLTPRPLQVPHGARGETVKPCAHGSTAKGSTCETCGGVK